MNYQTNQNVITVILPLHNINNDKLKKCLDSLVNQTFKYFSLFIINNDSDNDILKENLQLINEYKKILNITYKNTDNYISNDGASFIFVDKIKTKYACICNPNYVQYSDRLENQYINISTNKYDLLYGNININGNLILNKDSKLLNVNNFAFNNIFTFDTLMFNVKYVKDNWVIHSFDKLYENIHALLFNYSLLYYDNFNDKTLKIYYDSDPVIFSEDSNNYISFNQLTEIQKIGINKIYNNQIFYNTSNIVKKSNLTCVLICDRKTLYNYYELYKTILNIRFISNNIKIIISAYNINDDILSDFYYKLQVSYLQNESFIDAFNNGLNACDTENIIISSKPIRFNNKFDDYIDIMLNSKLYENTIIQPSLTDIDTFWGWQFEQNNNVRTGQKFILFNDQLTEKYNIPFNQVDKIDINIPILDDDLILISKKNTLVNLYGLYGLKYDKLANVFLSIKAYLNNVKLIINTNIKCNVINRSFENNYCKDIEESNIKNYNERLKYIYNLLIIVYLLFNESFMIYVNIINNTYNIPNEIEQIAEEIISNKELNEIKEKLIFENNINYFFHCMYSFDDNKLINDDNKLIIK